MQSFYYIDDKKCRVFIILMILDLAFFFESSDNDWKLPFTDSGSALT